MSGFTDMMIDDGFYDPEEYMEYLEQRYDRMQDDDNERMNEHNSDYDDDPWEESN